MNKEQILKEYYENIDKADEILSQLREHDFQPVEWNGVEYMFYEFHYDGVLLECLTEEFRLVYCGVYYLHNLKIL